MQRKEFNINHPEFSPVVLLTWVIKEFKSLPSVFTPEEKRDEIHEENNHDQTHTDKHFLQQEGFRGNTRHSRSNNNTEIIDYICDFPIIEWHIIIIIQCDSYILLIDYFQLWFLSDVTCDILLQNQKRKLSELITFQARNMTISSTSLILFS